MTIRMYSTQRTNKGKVGLTSSVSYLLKLECITLNIRYSCESIVAQYILILNIEFRACRIGLLGMKAERRRILAIHDLSVHILLVFVVRSRNSDKFVEVFDIGLHFMHLNPGSMGRVPISPILSLSLLFYPSSTCRAWSHARSTYSQTYICIQNRATFPYTVMRR